MLPIIPRTRAVPPTIQLWNGRVRVTRVIGSEDYRVKILIVTLADLLVRSRLLAVSTIGPVSQHRLTNVHNVRAP